jgi:hypothetical protein
MVMDWFATNFWSKGVLWLALRGQPLPLICAAAIAILRYTINGRYIFDVTFPTWSVFPTTTTFDHRTNHGYPSIVPEVFYTTNLACKAPTPTYTSKPFRLFVAKLRRLSKNWNHHDVTNKFPSFHLPLSSLDLWVNQWFPLYHLRMQKQVYHNTVDQRITITDNRD